MCSAPNHDMLLGPITRSGSTALSIEAVAAQWIAPRICATVQKNSMRRTADQVPLRLAEKKGSGMSTLRTNWSSAKVLYRMVQTPRLMTSAKL
jgi:hypothetical protein